MEISPRIGERTPAPRASHASPGPAAASRTEQLQGLRELIAREARLGETTAIDGVLLSAVEQVGEPAATRSGTMLAVIVQGAKRLAIGDRVYDYGPGQYLIASVDLPVTGHFTCASPAEPALGFGLVLRPAVVASLILAAGDASGWRVPRHDSTVAAPPALGVADAPVELLDAVTRMVRLLDASPADRAILAPMLEREILWRVITGPLGASLSEHGLADSNLARISRAVSWITNRYSEGFRVEDLARECGMSTSAFYRSFQAVTALSPIQFQKQVRLQASRLMLLSGGEDVATVGYRVGYESASQFSREYRREFGLPPAQDAARLRTDRDSMT